MYITKLQKVLTTPVTNKSSLQTIFWFSLSLSFAGIYGFLALQQAFKSEYVVSADASYYVLWLRRFLDPELLSSQDLIADYWQSMTPWGYLIFFRLLAILGIDPLLVSKCLPIILGMVTTTYCFWISLEILPVPAAGFFATLMINQALWMGVSLATGTPLSFIFPIFAAFLYYLLKGSLSLCLLTILLQGLFYPQYVLLSSGILILRLIKYQNKRLYFSQDRADYWFCFSGLLIGFLVLLPYLLKSSELGGSVSKLVAQTMPEFSAGGRNAFFPKGSPTLKYWLCARNGILPHDCRVSSSKFVSKTTDKSLKIVSQT